MNNVWDMWKKSFYAWENQTAQYLEQVLKSPLILKPGGVMLTSIAKNKAETDKRMATFWGNMGLPTKRDQERMLHAINQLQSRIYDLEEQLEDARADMARMTPAAPTPSDEAAAE